MEHNYLPNTAHSFFENGETEYRYFSEESMDNNWSMDWFIKQVGLSEFIIIHEGTQVVFKHPQYEQVLQVDAGGLGDFFSHKFKVSIYDGVLADSFLSVAQRLIDETKQYKDKYTAKQFSKLLKLEALAKTDRKKFVKQFKRITGATDWDLPDVIFAEG